MSNATITVVSTLGTGAWAGTPTVDASKISFTCNHGHGPISVASSSVLVDAATATVTFNMNRPLAKGEIIAWAAADRWLADGAGSYALAASGAEIVNNAAEKDLAGRTTATAAGVTIQWEEPATVRCRPAGIEIENPGDGITVTGWTPAPTATSGRVWNRAMKNPRAQANQGWDERGDATGDGRFDPALSLAGPVSLADGDSLVIQRGNPTPGGKAGVGPERPQYAFDFGGFLVSDELPAATVQLPALILGAVGQPRTRYTVDFDALAAAFPNRTVTGISTPPWQTLAAAIQLWPAGHAYSAEWTWGGPFTMPKEGFTPRDMTADNRSGYAQWIAVTTGTAVCALSLNAYTTAQKARLAAWLYRIGQTIYESYSTNGRGSFFGTGGHGQAFYAPIMLYLYWSGQTAKIATLREDVGTSELMQPYVLDAEMKGLIWEPHARGSNTPWLTWEKVVRAGSTDTSLILGATESTALLTTEAGLTGPRYQYTSAEMMLLRRADDTPVNQSLGIVTYPVIYGGTQPAFAITNPSAITVGVGDVVYMRPPGGEPDLGSYWWRIQGPPELGQAPQGHNANNPLPTANYLAMQEWVGQYLGLRSLGIWTNDHAFYGLVNRALNGGNPNFSELVTRTPFRLGGVEYPLVNGTLTQHRTAIEAVASLLD